LWNHHILNTHNAANIHHSLQANQQYLQAQAAQAKAQAQAQGQFNANNVRPTGNFNMPNNVSANLHIPPTRQRPMGNQQPGAVGSPMRLPVNVNGAQNLPQGAAQQAPAQIAAAVQAAQAVQMLNANMQARGTPAARPPLPGQATSQIRPQAILEQAAAAQNELAANAQMSRPMTSNFRRNSELVSAPMMHDQSGSLLNQANWKPSTEHDIKVREHLQAAVSVVRPHRAGAALGPLDKVLGEVVLAKMPDALAALLEEAEAGVGDDDDMGSMGPGQAKIKSDMADTGFPGQKKRSIQDVADSVDRGLIMEGGVENVSLR
jgi:hypothetical protein